MGRMLMRTLWGSPWTTLETGDKHWGTNLNPEASSIPSQDAPILPGTAAVH